MEVLGKIVAVPQTAESGSTERAKGSALTLWAVLAFTLLLASSWLVFPYFLEGKQILKNAGAELSESRNAQHRMLSEVLLRFADGPGEAEVDVLFATDTYFDRSSSPRIAAQYDTANNLVFLMNETVHIGELPVGVVRPRLAVDGVDVAGARVEAPDFADHHRATTIWFPRFDRSGEPTVPDGARKLMLTLSNNWDEADTPRQVIWDLPIDYPPEHDSVTSPMLILALSAGILSATLTPCLLQLIVVYMATLTGLAAEQLRRGGAVPADTRRRMFLIAIFFVIGVTFFYTLAGALIGYAGKAAQLTFEHYSREVAFGAGVLVILMGLWMGVQTRAPLVCKLPLPGAMARADRGGYLRSGLTAVGFSLGCMVCFSGSIMALLFIYVGAIGSAWIGASILFVFSMGVAIPFLAAAFFLSRTMSVMGWVSRYTPQLGLVSTIVIVGFGLVLLFDQFHTVSDLIYPWLGLN